MSVRTVYVSRPPRYTLGRFIWDAFLTIITSGLWLIWIFVREARGLRR